MNFSLASMTVTTDYLDFNATNYFYKNQVMIFDSTGSIVFLLVLIICCFGVPLNGIVIWLLGFQIKRNPFTVLILNLAIADFGFLVFMTINCIQILIRFFGPGVPWRIFFWLFHVTYINGLFLLTAISIDRCVCVLFPIWHRCSRPKYLSSAVCAFLWICSVLLGGIPNIVEYVFEYGRFKNLHLVVTAVFCLPLISISSLILFIKVCVKSQQIKRRRLLVMILITLLCFLILTLPLYCYVFVTHFLNKNNLFAANELALVLSPSASLNSSVNPVIYFLVGRKKGARKRESMKVIFRRVFREDEAPEI